MLNQQWLITFVTLAEVGHFTRTAEKLFMTQPGVSQHINKLEAQVETQLLTRKGKSFELTDAGLQLLAYAKGKIAEEAQLMLQLQVDEPHRGECRFACSGALAMHFYPRFVEYQLQHEQLQVSLQAAPNSSIINSILDHSIDVGIVTQQQSSLELTQQYLGKQALCLVLPPSLKGVDVTLSLLESIGFINHPDGHYYAEQLLGAHFGDEFVGMNKLKQRGYINQLNQILLPVSKGLGFTVLPQIVVDGYAEPLFVVNTVAEVAEELYMVTKTQRQLPSRYQWFIDTVTQQLASN
ncbi:LysR family transcriptional regulator [Shewanella youngdeokensis]|uniref:LysR family transcriptional regulator n=1 Tax=Shewanella youngdeokensis TaxID=2999068 RepID=A0ABZ0K1Z9_9GAMM|nr:LysR family transcriptional regulator [Shewanella sp. DAU334]